MPMDFPDFASLLDAAHVHGFRKPHENEPEDVYRAALAEYVTPIDRVEAAEIRAGVGWDKFTPRQAAEMVWGTRSTRAEHLAWCKQRALAYADAGDAQNTVASMLSDLNKHPDTQSSLSLAAYTGYGALLGGSIKPSPAELRNWVEEFN